MIFNIQILHNQHSCNEITKTKYYVESKFSNEYNNNCFRACYFNCRSLQNRNSRLKSNRISLQADLLKDRAIYKNKNYLREIVETDILLHYIAIANEYYWFPISYIYYGRYNYVKFLKMMERKSHFESAKILFNVNNVDDFKKMINKEEFNKRIAYQGSFEDVPNIKYNFNTEELAKY